MVTLIHISTLNTCHLGNKRLYLLNQIKKPDVSMPQLQEVSEASSHVFFVLYNLGVVMLLVPI